MATINFYLDRPDCFEHHPIFLVYQHYGQKFKIFTKERTEKKAWDFEKQRVKRNYTGYSEVNRNLNEIESVLLKIVRDTNFKSIEPLPAYVKEGYLKEINQDEKTEEIKPADFKTEFQAFIDSSTSLKSYNTIRSYKSTLEKIKAFEKKNKEKHFIWFDRSRFL